MDSLAIMYATHAVKQAQTYGLEYEEAVANLVLALIYNQENPELSITYAKQSLRFWIKKEDPHGMQSMLLSLARSFEQKGQSDSTLFYINKGLALEDNEGFSELTYELYKMKAAILDRQNQPKKAYSALRKADKAQQRMKVYQQRKLILEMEYRQERKEQTQQISFLTRYNRYLSTTAILLTLLIGLLLYFMYAFYQKRQVIREQNQQLTLQKDELESTLGIKQLLLKELQHRVKNNLALINSLIDQYIFNNKEILLLQELQARVHTVALGQTLLIEKYEDSSVSQTKYIHLATYIEQIVQSVSGISTREVEIQQQVINQQIEDQTCLALGLIINELIINTLKHAAPPKNQRLKVCIKIDQKEGQLHVLYSDNGAQFLTTEKAGVGRTIIDAMIQQLKGRLRREGSSYFILIPLPS